MEAIETSTVEELQDKDDLMLVTESSAVDVLDYIGAGDGWQEYQCAFVDTKHGEYSEVWVCRGIVPYTYKTAYRLI